MTDLVERLRKEARVARNAALEEAAEAVEAQPIRFADRVTAAAAIRALKEKP